MNLFIPAQSAFACSTMLNPSHALQMDSANTASWRTSTPDPHETLPTVAYCERPTDELTSISEKIAAVINDARSPSHYFIGPLKEDQRLFYRHETSDEKRIISIQAPESNHAPTTDYLIDLSDPTFFTNFNELCIAGSNAIVNGTIFYVRLPCEINSSFFMKRISLTNIIITQELCDALRSIVVDDLTLAGAVFSPLRLICPPSLHVLSLGAVASCPFVDTNTSTKKAWMIVDHSRCVHIEHIALKNGCTWKNGSSYYCRLIDMYSFEPFKIDHLATLSLTLHTTEILDRSYNFTLAIATIIKRLELHRFSPNTDSFNVVSFANDMRSYTCAPIVNPSDIDVQAVVMAWHDRGIIVVQLDSTFAALLPFSSTACWYRLFHAVVWEAPSDHTIPILFEEEYPLLFIPANTVKNAKCSVYVPASHEVDESNELHIKSTPFASGSFLLFNFVQTMCRVPNYSIRILPSEQVAYLPTVPIVRGANLPYLYSWLPSNPFSRNIPKKI